MSDLVTFLMAVAAFIFIAYPLLVRRPSSLPSSADDGLQELYSKRNTTYSMLKELEFDHESGILTDDDYRELESRYKNKAVSILKGIDERVESAADAGADVEARIRALRRGKKGAQAGDEIERRVRALRQARKPVDNAGDEIEAGVRSLRPAGKPAHGPEAETPAAEPRLHRGPFCPQCGAKSQDGDRFCTFCATRLS